MKGGVYRMLTTVKPFKIFANEIYKNVPGRGVFHRQGFFP